MTRLIQALAARPFSIVLVVLTLTALAVATLVDLRTLQLRLHIDPSFERLLPAHSDDLAVAERVRQQFGETNPVLLAVGFENVYTAPVLAQIEELTQKLARIGGVRQVLSLANAQNPVTDEFGINLSSFAQQARDDPAAVQTFAQAIADNPIYRGTLVSDDGRVAIFVLTLEGIDEVAFRQQHYTEKIRSLAQQVTGSDQVWVTGSPVVSAATTDAIFHMLQFTIPAIFVLVVLVLVVAFRNLLTVLLAGVNIAIALLWTLASAVALDLPLNMVTTLVPPLVTTLCLSYVVHLLAEYFHARRPEQNLARRARVYQRMGLSLLLSGATTVAGFLAMVPGSLPAIVQFAVLSSLGVGYSVLLTLLFLPAVLSLLGAHKSQRPLGEAFFIRKARKLALFDLKWRDWIIGISVLLIPINLYFASKIEVGTEYIKSFDPDTRVRHDYEAINTAFNGANLVSILIETYVNDALNNPALIAELDTLEDWLREQPEVGAVVSYVDHLKLINRNMNDGDPAFYRIPETATAVKQLLVFGGGDAIRRTLDARFASALITVRLKVDSSTIITDFVARTEARLQQMPPPLNGRVTGTPVLATRTVNEIASGQFTSLAIAFTVIWALLALLFTSARAAAIAMLPNMLPVVLYFGTLGLLGILLGPTTSLIACLVLGIAVDDTIHFLTRFTTEARARGNERLAIKRALSTVMRPVTFTTVALVLGFMVFLGSELDNQVEFGILAAFTLFLAWIADMTLTPALGSKMRLLTVWDLLRLDLGRAPQRTIPMLDGLTWWQARVFALMSNVEDYPKGTRVIVQGSSARDIYVLVDGLLQAWVDREGEHKVLSLMSRGATVGEAGYFGQKRTAHVDALTDVRLLRFDSHDLETLRRRFPWIAAVIYRNLNQIQAERMARMTRMVQ
ncbi:MMPL family transporter [Sinimarinibacterium sp. NLF-5-8]|uniref:MMPL family transporter n=1 Tax=Sinimarinibacterium sp. NLF-5-8 TaxID=2698684 RepID=UPI001EE49274|nr:MMPL family transporter [Sinimarinibacterium sp. NLF-5-8]